VDAAGSTRCRDPAQARGGDLPNDPAQGIRAASGCFSSGGRSGRSSEYYVPLTPEALDIGPRRSRAPGNWKASGGPGNRAQAVQVSRADDGPSGGPAAGAGMRLKPIKGTQITVLFFHPTTDNAFVARTARFASCSAWTLGRRVPCRIRILSENDKEIAILTRSILQVLIDIASMIDVPRRSVEGVCTARRTRTGAHVSATPHVRHGARPKTPMYPSVPKTSGLDRRPRPTVEKHVQFPSPHVSLTETANSAAPLVTIPAVEMGIP